MNIADLDKVSIDLEIVPDSFEVEENGVKKTVEQEVIVVDEIKYRFPTSVRAQLQVLLADNPELKFFKVRKSGSGMETRYQCIPILA